MRVRPQPHKLEIRLTFNIFTLTRFVRVDADGDTKISMVELAAAEPVLTEYLNKHLLMEVNGQKSTLGSRARFDHLWPNSEKTEPMTEAEYAARNVDVTFTLPVEDRLLEDFWLGFEIFEQTGPLQTIRGIYEQDGQTEEVPFSVEFAEYLYDTGYVDDPFVQAAEKKTMEPPSEQRWWMLRAVVFIVVIVLGRVATLSRRAAKLPTRRQRRS
ncbi:hypothetical protein [Prosthecobacter sp.]|uniref:hypothetical protein n=1 Tax=Prosthecobacter sp. TaxID=1965333 RepID=UPI002ABBEB8C|nr:hypothetical protein [Prosthecobacter sp.]MDZ4406324.1 hypothetical protein [Prosthecobacter sp.]